LKFLQDQLFTTPEWMIDAEILGRIEHAGNTNRLRRTQERTLNNILDFGRLARMIENEALNGSEAYAMIDMMRDLRRGIWKETSGGRKIDVYRRNLQRAYIERMEYLMTAEQQQVPARFRNFVTQSTINVSQSDIRSVARAELNILKRSIRSAIGQTSDSMSKYHLQDALERIELILDPK